MNEFCRSPVMKMWRRKKISFQPNFIRLQNGVDEKRGKCLIVQYPHASTSRWKKQRERAKIDGKIEQFSALNFESFAIFCVAVRPLIYCLFLFRNRKNNK